MDYTHRLPLLYRGGIFLRRRTSTGGTTFGLNILVFWTLLWSSSPAVTPVHAIHPYGSGSGSHHGGGGNFNCAFMNACDVTEILMQEINALKEKLAELVNFQVDVNQFKFEHGIHRSEMDEFREHVENFMKSQNAPSKPASNSGSNHGNDVADTSHADAPNQSTNQKDAMTLPAIHNRLEQVENTVRQWDANVLSSTRNGESIRQTLEREEGTRKVLEEKIGHVQKKMDDIQTSVKEEKVKSETMKNEVWDLKQATNKHESALGRQQDVIQNVNRTLRARVTDLEENMGYFTSNLFQLSYRGDEFMENITREVETVKKTTNSKFANVSGHIDRLTSQLNHVATDLGNVTKEVDFIDGDINEVKMQVETFVNRMFTFDMTFTKHSRELQAVLKSVHETNGTMQRVWQTMDSVAEDVENLKSDVTNWEEALVSLNVSITANNQEIDTLWQATEANVTDLQRQLRLTDRSLDDFRTSIAIDVRRLISHHDDMERRMDAAESYRKWVENEVKAYEFVVGKYENEIKILKEQSTANNANVKELKNDVKMIQTSLNSVRKYQTELKANATEMMQNVLPLLSTTAAPTDAPVRVHNSTKKMEPSIANVTTLAPPPTEEEEETDINEEDQLIAESLTMQAEEATSSGCLFVPSTLVNVVTSIRGRPIKNMQKLEFKAGDELFHHCTDIGSYRMEGDVKRTCLKNGSWTGSQPLCHKLTSVDDFVAGAYPNILAPPAIEIFPPPESPSTGVTPNGSLVVTTGSRIALSCVFPKIAGAVTWKHAQSAGSRGIAVGGFWKEDIRNEMKMQSARPEQSGHYTCKISNGGSNTIHVIVQDVACSSPPENPHLHILDPVKLRLNSHLKFQCKELGYVLSFPDAESYNSTSAAEDIIGDTDDDFRCLASGEWSRDFPTCVRKFRRGG